MRSARPAAAIIVSLLLASMPVEARATSEAPRRAGDLGDLRDERARLRVERAEAGRAVDGLTARADEVRTALDALDAEVRAQQQLVDEADAALQRARRSADEADEAHAAAEAALAAVVAEMRATAAESFVRLTSSGGESAIGGDVNDLVQRRAYAAHLGSRSAQLDDRHRVAVEEMALQQGVARAARATAAERSSALEERRARLGEASDAQARLAANIDTRLDAALAEAEALATVDARVAAAITREETALARRAAAAAPAPSRAPGGSGAQSSAPAGGRAPGDTPRTSSPPSTPVGDGEIVAVRGIRVHRSIAASLERLLVDAAAAGIRLSGGGYRDRPSQIATRRANCGDGDYNIFHKPSTQCSPPTARPGNSMHERGLAIDITQDGRLLSRSSSGFAWLRANASRYGLYNLPSEPWHWSTNGN